MREEDLEQCRSGKFGIKKEQVVEAGCPTPWMSQDKQRVSFNFDLFDLPTIPEILKTPQEGIDNAGHRNRACSRKTFQGDFELAVGQQLYPVPHSDPINIGKPHRLTCPSEISGGQNSGFGLFGRYRIVNPWFLDLSLGLGQRDERCGILQVALQNAGGDQPALPIRLVWAAIAEVHLSRRQHIHRLQNDDVLGVDRAE